MERVGFVGLGIMGKPMAINLVKAGYDLTFYARRPQVIEEMEGLGARAVASAAAVAEHTDIIITIVTADPEVREVILGDHLSRQSNLARCLMAGSPPVVKCEPRCFSCSGPAGEPCEFAVAARCRGPIVNAV